MLKIRLTRVGRKNDPSFRVVVIDSRKATRAGSSIENLGSYEPKKKTTQLKSERIQHWISKGAKLSDTVHNLLIKNKVITGKKIDVSAKKKGVDPKSVGETKGETKAESKE